MTAHGTQVAASTQAVIVHLCENGNRLFVSEHRDDLMTTEDRSEDMKQTVDQFLEYEKTQQRLRQLGRSWSSWAGVVDRASGEIQSSLRIGRFSQTRVLGINRRPDHAQKRQLIHTN
jgi:hypothetical protein